MLAPLVAFPASGVTGGHSDGTDHPNVGLLLDAGGKPHCSGVYVDGGAHKVFISVAHCVYRPGHSTGTVRVTFDAKWSSHPHTLTGRYTVDPRYDPRTHVHDYAVIRLDRQPAVKPALLPAKGAAAAAKRVVVVGYGEPFRGVRRSATERVTSITPNWMHLVPGSGNTCDGDSGAPDFALDEVTVLALTDQGSCVDDEDARIDTAAARAFILSVAR